jgi:hypothetical protein
MDIDIDRVEKAVAAEITRYALDQINPIEMLEKAVQARINQVFEERAEDAINTAVNNAIREGFEHVYCAVDCFGRPAGEPTTIRAELAKLVAGYWNARVDRNGKPTDRYGENTTRAEWIMAKMCADDFQGHMAQHVANVGGGLKDELRKSLRATLDDLLSRVFRVQTQNDVKGTI